MSYVTNIVLICDIMDDHDERLAQVNAQLDEKHHLIRSQGKEWYGGTKCFEVGVWGLAANYMQPPDFEEFKALLKTVPWRDPIYIYWKTEEYPAIMEKIEP